MESKNLDKAIEIYSKLISGEEICKKHPDNGPLYDEFYGNAEVYDIVMNMMKKMNLSLYEYNDSLYITAGEGNRVFGYTNDDMKKLLGLRLNKELYLCYFIMYMTLLYFYKDSSSYQFREYVKSENIIDETSKYLADITKKLDVLSTDEVEQDSFKAIALLWDELPAVTGNQEGDSARASKASRAGYVKDNIIYKACRMMKDIYGIDKGVHVTVDKHIPVAAGMAGGSADAAAALKAMNMLFGLNLSDEQLMEHGVKLGADVPYCIMQGTALSEGIGEILTPLPPMPDCLIVIAKPAIGVSTKWVYQNLKVDLLEEHPDIDGMADALKTGDLKGITDRMANVLETVTIPANPVIDSVKKLIAENDSMGVLMSGSGPTVFGIYDNRDKELAQRVVDMLREKDEIQAAYAVNPYNIRRGM